MFSLGQEIGGGETWLCGVIRQDQHLTRTGEKINSNMAKKQPFGCDDIGIAGSKYFLNFANGRSSEGHRSYSLGTARFINFSGTCFSQSKQQGGINLSRGIARRANHDFPASS